MNKRNLVFILIICLSLFFTACMGETTKVKMASIVSGNKTIRVGETVKLLINIDSEDGQYKNITWYSANKGIATVDSNGIVTGVAKGITQIKVSVDGNVDTVNVTVRVPVPRGTIYSAIGGDNADYKSDCGSPITELKNYEGYGYVLKVTEGYGWGSGGFAYLVFSGYPDFGSEFNALEYKVKSDKTTMTAKVQNSSSNTEKIVTLAANTDISKGYLCEDLGNGWFKMTVPFTQTSTTQTLLFGGWMVKQTLYLTDINFVKI